MRIVRRLLPLVLVCSCLAPASADDEFVRPIRGSLVLAGRGEIHPAVRDVFLDLCGAPGARIVVVATEAKPETVELWEKAGALEVVAVDDAKRSAGARTKALLRANGVWFEDGAVDLRRDERFTTLLRALLERGGVIGGAGRGATALGVRGVDEGRAVKGEGFGLLPASAVELLAGSAARAAGRTSDAVAGGDGRVAWQIPRSTALVVHTGRRVGVYGKGDIVARVAASEGWPERKQLIEGDATFGHSEEFDYRTDLLAWMRSARDRTGPVFPATKPIPARVPKGTLVLSGGGKVTDAMFEAFIESAGGKTAPIVCIPSGMHFEPGERITSYSARRLKSLGCKHVTLLHAVDPRRAHVSPRWLKPLEHAQGVWIDGGRTYRLVDALEGTKAHELMRAVLKRGGAVGGSSAGCQVLGMFLLRGDPKTNDTHVYDGYTRGLGLLPGVVLDAHFRQRERERPLRELIADMPQLLGIGVDADTAIVVKGVEARVLGEEAVTFHAAEGGKVRPVELRDGDVYDLLKRRAER